MLRRYQRPQQAKQSMRITRCIEEFEVTLNLKRMKEVYREGKTDGGYCYDWRTGVSHREVSSGISLVSSLGSDTLQLFIRCKDSNSPDGALNIREGHLLKLGGNNGDIHRQRPYKLRQGGPNYASFELQQLTSNFYTITLEPQAKAVSSL